jgi:hypothetical protein
MRVILILSVLACGCRKAPDETFWRDRPDVLVKSEVAGHAYTIQMPRNHETTRTEHGEAFSIHGHRLVEIAWTTPTAATERVAKGARGRTELTKLGFDGAVPPDVVVDDINTVTEIKLELAGPKLGFITELPAEGGGGIEIFAFLPSGLVDGGFTCTSTRFNNSAGEAEMKKNLDRIRGVCLSLRTATKDATSLPK